MNKKIILVIAIPLLILIAILPSLEPLIPFSQFRELVAFSTNVPEGYEVRELPEEETERFLSIVDGAKIMRIGNIYFQGERIGDEISLACGNVEKCSKSFLNGWGYDPESLNITEISTTIDGHDVTTDTTGSIYYASKKFEFYIIIIFPEHKEVGVSLMKDILADS